MTDARVTVMLVDDHAVVRTGYRMLLEMQGEYEVVCEVGSGEDALLAYPELMPDVVIMDLNLPGRSGIEVTRRILAIDPEAKILVFSIHAEAIYVSRAFEAGACGYLCKSSSPVQMMDAVLAVAERGHYLDPHVSFPSGRGSEHLKDPIRWLSAREFEIFQLLGSGLASREISEALALSPKTVSNALVIIKEKVGVGSTAELVRIAARLSEDPVGQKG